MALTRRLVWTTQAPCREPSSHGRLASMGTDYKAPGRHLSPLRPATDAANGRMLFCPPFSTFSFCFRQLVVYGYSVMVCPDSRFSRLCTEFLRLFGGDSFVTKVSRVCVRIPCWQRLCFLYNGCPYAHTLTLSTSHTHTHTHTLLTESVSE